MGEMRSWTLAEAAFVLDRPLDAMKRIVDRGPVKTRLVKHRSGSSRTLALRDLVYLRASHALKDELTVKARDDLYRALTKVSLIDEQPIAFGPIRLDLTEYVRDVKRRIDVLNAHSQRIETGPDGEALIKGTRIEAHRIAALLDGGMPIENVLADYPSLDETQVTAAKAYADTHPKPGRPYPAMTAKAAMRSADLDDLDRFMTPPER